MASLPWWGRMAIKAVLARLPVNRLVWRQLGVFNFGPMEQPEYAYSVFFRHHSRYQRPRPGFVTLEVGPGHSAFSALIGKALGGSGCYLVDVGDFIVRDAELYKSMAAFLEKKRTPIPDVAAATSFDEIMERCSAKYLTAGLESLRTIPDRSVDFIFSHGAIQSVHKDQFDDYLREFRRIVRDDGVCSHLVDLKDMLGGALNHLRFSDGFWNSRFIVRSGFYSNRIRYEDMLERFRKAGFEYEVVDAKRWPELPTPRAKLGRFRNLPDDGLRVSVFQAVLKPVPMRAGQHASASADRRIPVG